MKIIRCYPHFYDSRIVAEDMGTDRKYRTENLF
jgi:hypothetical protein